MSQRCIDRLGRNQDGIYLPLLVVLIVAFIALLGLAIDVGNLYRAKLRLQRAVDSGVVGASRIIGSGPNEYVNNGRAKDVAEEIARDNLLGMDPLLPDGFPTANIYGNILSMNGNMQLPTFLLRVIPGLPNENTAHAHASAANQRAVVLLILDLSGSMRATCTTTNGFTTITSDKIGALREATKKFIDKFQDGWDYIGVVGFNRRAFSIHDFFSGGTLTALNKAALKAKIDKLGTTIEVADPSSINKNCVSVEGDNGAHSPYPLRSGTNTDHALGVGRVVLNEFRRYGTSTSGDPDNPIFENANRAILLVTDGAPTTSCTGVGTSPVELNVSNFTCNGINPTDEVPGYQSNRVHYHRAIKQSDNLRDVIRTPIHVVGIGTLSDAPSKGKYPEPLNQYTPVELSDAYQSYNDNDALHSTFLRRISLVANDPDEHLGTDFNVLALPPATNVIYTYTGTSYFAGSVKRISEYLASYPTTHGGEPAPIGKYYASPTEAELEQIMSSIGRSIISRLVR